MEEVEEGLSGKSGNKFAALTTSKNLTEVEKLKLPVAKQEIEIARLKKGYFVVEELREKYSVNFLCRLMKLNRSGYYKRRERRGKKNIREKRREEITGKLKEAHKKYPSHDYHRLAWCIEDKSDHYVSDNVVHLCCKSAGIFSKARNPAKSLPGR